MRRQVRFNGFEPFLDPLFSADTRSATSGACHVRRTDESAVLRWPPWPKASTMDWKPFITSDPHIMHGAVCVRGTRIPVAVVLDNLAAGETPERILE